MKRIKTEGIEVVVYKPALQEETFPNSKVVKYLEEFKKVSDMIMANRLLDDLSKVKD